MWKHEIIDCIQKTTKTYSMLERAGLKSTYKDIQPTLQTLAQEAQTFYFGDREDSLIPAVRTLKGQQFFLPLKMPFECTLFEYTCNKLDESGMKDFQRFSSRRCSLVFTPPNGKQFFFNFNYCDELNCWDMPFVYLLAEEKNNWAGHHYSLIEPGHHPSVTEETILQFGKELNDEVGACATMVNILNCQNVITKDVEPPEKLNRKRKKHRQTPLYSYKILEVVKGKPKTKDAGSVPWDYKSPEAVRFHLCRGHFKTYTEDRKLFGKYTGTFWWNPQSRGDRSKGVVEKEYSVKVDEGLAI